MAGRTPDRTGPGGNGTPRRQVVGRGLNGRPFYSEAAYRRSAAYRFQNSGQPVDVGGPGGPPRRGGGTVPVHTIGPPPRVPGRTGKLNPIGMGNRLGGGVSQAFPHVGAPAAPNTFDQHFEQVRSNLLGGGM